MHTILIVVFILKMYKKLSNQFLTHKDCSFSQQIQKVFKLKFRKGKVVKVEMMK